MWPNFRNPTNWLETLHPAKGPPPQQLMPFVNWSFNCSYLVLLLATLASITSGGVEMLTAALLGMVLDVISDTGPEKLFAEQDIFLIAICVFILIIRPIFSTYRPMRNLL